MFSTLTRVNVAPMWWHCLDNNTILLAPSESRETFESSNHLIWFLELVVRSVWVSTNEEKLLNTYPVPLALTWCCCFWTTFGNMLYTSSPAAFQTVVLKLALSPASARQSTRNWMRRLSSSVVQMLRSGPVVVTDIMKMEWRLLEGRLVVEVRVRITDWWYR